MRIEKKQASSSPITVCHPVNTTILAISIRNIFIFILFMCHFMQNKTKLSTARKTNN